MSQLIGKPLRRKEDLRLFTGNGRYSDDVNLPGQAYAHVLRSPHAHARIQAKVRLDIGVPPDLNAAVAGGRLDELADMVR
jgi:carbon-monoxide dehydrogenase large subunit